jgi:hypothetical protein
MTWKDNLTFCTASFLNSESESIFLSNTPRFPKQRPHWKVPRFQSCVLVIKATRTLIHVRTIGGMMLRGISEVLADTQSPVPLCPPQISYELTWNRKRASAVTGR